MTDRPPPLSPLWQKLPGAAARVTLAIAILVLCGWLFDIPWLTTAHTHFVAMKVNTAIGFLLAGTALMLVSKAPWRRRPLLRLCACAAALLVGLLGMATLLEHGGHDLDLDNLLIQEAPGAYGTLAPGRMAPSSALCFFLLGWALCLEAASSKYWGLVQALTVAAILPPLLAVLATVYGQDPHYGLGYANQMALPAMAGFLALGLGILGLHQDRGLLSLLQRRGIARLILVTILPAALILPALLGWLTAAGAGQGLFEYQFGLLLMVVTEMVLAFAVIIPVAISAGRLESDKQRIADEYQRSHAALENAKALLQGVIDAVPEWIYVTTADGRLSLVNRAFAEACQSRPAEMVGYPAANFGPAAYIEQEPPSSLGEDYDDPMFQAGVSKQALVRVALANGSSRVFEVYKASLSKAGRESSGALCYCRDVTDQRQAMQEHLALVTKLSQAQKMETIGMLSGGIAHDFNNILAAVIGYAELGLILAPGSGDPSRQKTVTYFSGILQAANRAKELVRQLLTFSRSKEAGEIDNALVKPIVAEVVNLLRSTLPASIDLDARIAEDLPPVRFGPVKLHQVLMNLCINARDALSGKGRIAIRAAAAKLDQFCACDSCHQDFRGDYVVVSVKDNGVGIAAAERAKIFSPFYTTKDVGEGTGLGLSVLHGIVHAAGGHIKLISDAGIGSEFLIYLPTLPPVAQTHSASPSAAAANDGKGSSARILVIDDEAAVASIFTELLALLGYQVTTLTSAHDALLLFRKDPLGFDLVITDQTMPGLTGDELASALLVIRPDLPIILCSGYSGVDEEAAHRLGVRRLLAKPVTNADLCAAVRDCLG